METSLIAVLGQIAAGPLAVYLASAGLSYLAENWQKWHTFSPNVKRAVFVVIALILGGAAQFLLTDPTAVKIVDQIGPTYTFVMVTLSWIASQKTYANSRAGYYGIKAQNQADYTE